MTKESRPVWLREEHAQRFVDIAVKLQRMDGMGDLADAQFLMDLSEMVDAAPADAEQKLLAARMRAEKVYNGTDPYPMRGDGYIAMTLIDAVLAGLKQEDA